MILWKSIATTLEADIRNGAYAPGARMPTEAELAMRFRVNRHTVRRAMAALQEKELVRVEQGRGTFVQDHVIEYAVTKRTRFSENINLQRRSPGGTLLSSTESVADEDISRALQIPEIRRVLRLDILREADCRPIAIASHIFPLPRFSGLVEIFRETGSVTASLRRFGVQDYQRVFTRITARVPTAEEAEVLGQPRSRPVLVARSVNVDPRGVPVDYGIACYASDRVQFVLHSE
ncbi:MAG: phosphonate metabolism transcriptional regulator PhnF [Desulfocurvibacter africanus]